jgi:hypothetical protein
MQIRCPLVPLLAAIAALLAAGPVSAGGHVGVQVGGFAPWSGDAGVMTAIQILGSNTSGRSRWGGEFEVREFDSKISGVNDVDVESYLLRGMWQYHFRPDDRVTPYVGVGLGVVISVVDDDKIDGFYGFNARDSVGAGLDGVFLLGVSMNIPGAEYMSIFAEGRLGLAFDVAGDGSSDDVSVENVGGGSGSAGVRFRF